MSADAETDAPLGERTNSRDDPPSDCEVGKKEHDDLKTRQAQQNGKSENCLEVNITKFGKQYHGIEKGDLVEVAVHEEGIVIKPYPGPDSKR